MTTSQSAGTRDALRPDAEVPPIKELRRWDIAPPGCRMLETEHFGYESGRPMWDVVFGRRQYTNLVEFARYEHSSGAYVMRGRQYDGFDKRPWNAFLPGNKLMTSEPRTTRRGTWIMRQTRWWKTAAAAMDAVEKELARATPPAAAPTETEK